MVKVRCQHEPDASNHTLKQGKTASSEGHKVMVCLKGKFYITLLKEKKSWSHIGDRIGGSGDGGRGSGTGRQLVGVISLSVLGEKNHRPLLREEHFSQN